MHYLAELYLPTAARERDETVRSLIAAEERIGQRVSVRLVQTIVVPDDETCFAVYEADSSDAVTRAGERVGLTFDRIREAVLPRR